MVHIGNLALSAAHRYVVLKNYAAFYQALTRDGVDVAVFAPVIRPGEPGYEFLDEIAIDPRVRLTTSPGNTPESPVLRFVANNLRVTAGVIRFCCPRADYFVFLPSFPGAVALLWLLSTRRYRSLGLYIGGDFAAEQLHEPRRSLFKRVAKRLGASAITRIIDNGIRTADYVLTASHKYYHHHSATSAIRLAPGLINVAEADMEQPLPPVPDQELPLVYCGELRVAKGVMVLLEAFRLLRERHPELPYTLRILGSGHAEQAMREYVATHRLDRWVKFSGQIKERAELHRQFRECFALVLPSFSEGFPRVAYEAFALGLPTLLTPVGGIPYLLRDREQTIFLTLDDPADIVDKITLLQRDPALRAHLVAAGRQLMREQVFPWFRRYGSLARMVQLGARGQLRPAPASPPAGLRPLES